MTETDPGVVLSLFRMRAARFTDDLPTIALAELLDEGLLANRTPGPATLDAVGAFLDVIRTRGPPRCRCRGRPRGRRPPRRTAIEHGCELVSFDRDFARFAGLRWVRPGSMPSPGDPR